MAAFPPGPEVGTELVFAQTETLQFSLHQPASLQHLVPITQVALLGQGHVEANGAAWRVTSIGVDDSRWEASPSANGRSQCPLHGAMTPTTASKAIEPRLAGTVAGIRQLIRIEGPR